MRYAYFIRRLAIIMRHDIFSTPVWHIEGTPQQLIDDLYQGAYKFKEVYTDTPQRSNEGGYQSPALSWNDFHPQGRKYMNMVINECDNQVFESFNIQGWWYNINGKGDWNIPHTHPNSDLALVIYLTDTDNLLTFVNPHAQRKKTSKQNSTPQTKKGDILIFPSDLVHYAMPNPREEDRVSISMNLQLS